LDTGDRPLGLAIERVGGIAVFWIGSLVDQSLIKLEMDDGRIVREEYIFRNELGRVRDVRIGPDGLLYLITDDREGMLYRLESLPLLGRADEVKE
jgi:glucose/arabinose dehydrogenase